MSKYYRRPLPSPAQPPRPAVRPLTGLQPMYRGPWDAVHGAQDQVVGLGRRVLCTGGLRGSDEWMVDNTTDPSTKTWPQVDTWRTQAAAYVRLTPGCFPAVRVIYMLSGPCEESD